jgi:hypothetical protein
MTTYTAKQRELIKERLISLGDTRLHDAYDNMLDDCHGECTIAGARFQTSAALKELDEIMYDCGYSDWLDSEIGETITDEIDGEYYDLNEVNDLIDNMDDDDEGDE